MGRYAIEPDNATKSAKAKVRFNSIGVSWLVRRRHFNMKLEKRDLLELHSLIDLIDYWMLNNFLKFMLQGSNLRVHFKNTRETAQAIKAMPLHR